ncbi:hypothetical protein N7465_006194 [Penicillium sp. CMV-2018d]|nr:hypothetical protein N7465_006194 [Penicillium sp. CMV-2018d]
MKRSCIPPGDRKRRNQKPRVLFSCKPCRDGKLKCNRKQPCESCLKRNQDEFCRYTTEDSPDSPHDESQMLQSRLAHVEQRLQYLETAFQSQHALHAYSESPSTGPNNSRQVTCPNNLIRQHVLDAQPSSNNPTTEAPAIRFVNPSHWRSIMNNATRELGRSNYDASTEDGTIDVEPRSRIPILLGSIQEAGINDLLAALPPRKDADALSTFMALHSKQKYASLLYLISLKDSDNRIKYEEFWKSPSTVSLAWLALLFGLFSCGIFIQHSVTPGTAETVLPNIFDFYRTKCATALTNSNYAIPGRHKVEAAVTYLGVEYLQSDELRTGMSVLIGVISRVATVMGYHRDPDLYPELSVFEREMRRRTWLVLVVLDHAIALDTGLLPVTQKRPGNATRPRNLLDDDLGPTVTILPPARPNTETTNISFMVAMEEMLSMASEISDAASGLTLTIEKTMELNEQLEATWNQIPAPWNMSSLNEVAGDDNATIQRLSLGMTYQRARCILHRQHLVTRNGGPDFNDFHRVCVDAARRILQYQSELFQGVFSLPKYRCRVWFGMSRSISDCMTAAMVICLEVINQSKLDITAESWNRKELIGLLTTSHATWKFSSRPSPETAKAAEIVAMMLHLLGSYHKNGAQGFQVPTTNNMPIFEPLSSFPFYDARNSLSTIDMFDWALWDREMKQLDDIARGY